MSANAVSWAWEQKRVEKNEKFLLLYLADSADRRGRWANLSDLLGDAADVMGIGTQVVQKHFATLIEKGLIRKADRSHRLCLEPPSLGAFRLSET